MTVRGVTQAESDRLGFTVLLPSSELPWEKVEGCSEVAVTFLPL